jgi:hypothetical protein
MIRSWTWNAITNLLISLVGVLVGVVFVLLRADIKNLRAEFNGFRSDTDRRFGEELATLKQHGERLARLETLVSFLIAPRSVESPTPRPKRRRWQPSRR